jgi:hypothetical protein
VSIEAGAAYVLAAVRVAVILAAANAGRASREVIMVRLCPAVIQRMVLLLEGELEN